LQTNVVAAGVTGNDGKWLAGIQPIVRRAYCESSALQEQIGTNDVISKSASGCFRRDGQEPSQQRGRSLS
jgi:hypothetical protein